MPYENSNSVCVCVCVWVCVCVCVCVRVCVYLVALIADQFDTALVVTSSSYSELQRLKIHTVHL